MAAFEELVFDEATFDTFGALLARHAIDFVVLAEVQIMEPLGVWTAAGGGLTNTWYASFPTQIATSVVGGGMYRRLDEVRQNATALTSRASAALVDSNLGSYFHDTANSRIYVSTAAGTSPDLAALVGAWFTLFFSTRAVDFSDQPVYAPILTGELPSLRSEMPDPLFGAITSDTGSLSLLNGDGLFDRMSRQYVWRNKRVAVKLGGLSLDYSDFATVTTMRINSIGVSDDVATLQLEQIGSILNRSIPPRTWGDGLTFSAVGEGILKDSQPWIFGVAKDCHLPLTDNTSDGEYQFVDLLLSPSGATVNAVYAIHRTTRERTTLSSPADYGASSTTVTLLPHTQAIDFASFASPTVVFTFTAHGLTTGDTVIISGSSTSPSIDGEWGVTVISFNAFEVPVNVSGSGAGGLITKRGYTHQDYEILADLTGLVSAPTFGSIVPALLLELGEHSGNIDTAAFAAIDAPQQIGCYLTEPIQAADLLLELEQSVLAQVYVGADGRWTCRKFNPSSSASFTLTDEDFAAWDSDDDLAAVLNEVRVQYDHRHATDSTSEAASSDDAVRYGSETSDSHQVFTYLRDSADASSLAQRYRFYKGAPSARIRFEERGLTLMTAVVGDLVAVTRDRGPVARTGRFDGHILQIVELEKALGPDAPTVRGVLWDFGGQTDRIARYAEAGSTLTWAAASAEERATLGFYADSNGYIDPADGLTRHLKVYS